MTVHTYTAAEMSPLTDVMDIERRGFAHGYTGISCAHVIDDDGDNYLFTFNEADDKATTKTNLDAATVPVLSLTSYDVQCAGDGVATVTVTLSDSRGAGASGKVVCVEGPQTHLTPTPFATLDGSGEVVLTFGPSPSAGWVGSVEVTMFYGDFQEAAAIVGKFSYT